MSQPTSPRALHPALALALVLALAPAAVLLAAPSARAADNGQWSVFPAAAGPGGRPYFYLSADPGQSVTDKVTVTNRTAAPLTFRLYAADAYNTPRDGGFAVRSPDERQRGVGAWASPARERITVPARGSVTVPYTLTVPESAEPGDHPGALVALDERVAPPKGPVAVGVRQAVGARVHLRVNGPAVPALSVEDVRIDQDRPPAPGLGESSALISYTLHNRGNVTLDPTVTLKAEGLFGRDLLSRRLTKVPAELLPRQRIRLTERWSGSPQLEWGEIRLTATAREVRESAGASFLAVPWGAAAVLAAAAAGLAFRFRERLLHRLRNGPRNRRAATPGPG
ncbi:WxL protein peptidoglycan domain-containing protein [Streptomyces sp. NPDC020141]|uniref:WxL protein peptidoglycan domain-containing protein n=1 Tax=Streptomyces sp. NPDC020141 TaxID=3365065 RepID=UPI00379E75B6